MIVDGPDTVLEMDELLFSCEDIFGHEDGDELVD